jgi:addiction module RelE/StbE family toxin
MTTGYRIAWRPMAEVDLAGIIDYIGRDNPARAEAFGREIRDKTLALAQSPEMGRTGRPGIPACVRELVVHRNYIIFYRVIEQTTTVELLRVKHAAQQMP